MAGRFIEWPDMQDAAQELVTEGVLPSGAETAFDTLGSVNISQLTGDNASTADNVIEAMFKMYLVTVRAQQLRNVINAAATPALPLITSFTPPDYGSISPAGFATVAMNYSVELPVSASTVQGVT